ncbi:MAG: hypothetical protein HC804_09595 [Anaerolineae bacterium]|nr:hypothetical protein [Anaerolineae bacterium]
MNRTTSGAANVDVDYALIFPRPYGMIDGYLSSSRVYMLEGKRVIGSVSGSFNDFVIQDSTIPYRGDVLEVMPDRLNMLLSAIYSGTTGAAITNTLTHTIPNNATLGNSLMADLTISAFQPFATTVRPDPAEDLIRAP